MKKLFRLFPTVFLIFTGCLYARTAVHFSLPGHEHLFSSDTFVTTALPARNEKRPGDKNKVPIPFSDPADHFRSASSGDWNVNATWESSPDNGITPWAAATLIPTSAAKAIRIKNTHTVTVNSNQDMDDVIIENGGILLHSLNTLTVNNGTGDDIIVQGGGIFTLANSSGPTFSGGATAFINPSGMLRLSASGLTGAGAGVHASNFVYSDASVLEYTLSLLFSTDGVTFFPNANAATIPVFRITGNIGAVGAVTTTTINGLFEANGNITFQNTGTKIFRNGIIGTGHVDGSTSGKFMINGITAKLGGTGLLTLPATAGMDIGTSATVTMVSDKSVTGNIAFLANSFIILGSHNLTMTGIFSGYSATSHVVTDGSGKVVINNVGSFPGVTFPIGANTTTINPVMIFNGEGLNYGARVENGINPPIRFPIAAVNRTWVIRPSATPAGTVNIDFLYNNTAGNALFNYAPATVEHGFYTSVWNVINTGLTQVGGPPNFNVTTSANIFAANTDAPMVIANIGAILAVNHSILLAAQKHNDKSILNWSVNNPVVIGSFILERSGDARTYIALTELPPAGFSFTDDRALPGLNYYRIKMIDKNGQSTYSNIAVILNAQKGVELMSITPNPVVNGNFKLNISAAKKTQVEIVITDMQGRVVKDQTVNLIAGFNTINMNVTDLSTGTYQVYGNTMDGRSRVLRFVIR